MISVVVELVGEPEDLWRAELDAESASLTPIPVNVNPSSEFPAFNCWCCFGHLSPNPVTFSPAIQTICPNCGPAHYCYAFSSPDWHVRSGKIVKYQGRRLGGFAKADGDSYPIQNQQDTMNIAPQIGIRACTQQLACPGHYLVNPIHRSQSGPRQEADSAREYGTWRDSSQNARFAGARKTAEHAAIHPGRP